MASVEATILTPSSHLHILGPTSRLVLAVVVEAFLPARSIYLHCRQTRLLISWTLDDDVHLADHVFFLISFCFRLLRLPNYIASGRLISTLACGS